MNVSFYNARSFSKSNGIFWAFSLKETKFEVRCTAGMVPRLLRVQESKQFRRKSLLLHATLYFYSITS